MTGLEEKSQIQVIFCLLIYIEVSPFNYIVFNLIYSPQGNSFQALSYSSSLSKSLMVRYAQYCKLPCDPSPQQSIEHEEEYRNVSGMLSVKTLCTKIQPFFEEYMDETKRVYALDLHGTQANFLLQKNIQRIGIQKKAIRDLVNLSEYLAYKNQELKKLQLSLKASLQEQFRIFKSSISDALNTIYSQYSRILKDQFQNFKEQTQKQTKIIKTELRRLQRECDDSILKRRKLTIEQASSILGIPKQQIYGYQILLKIVTKQTLNELQDQGRPRLQRQIQIDRSKIKEIDCHQLWVLMQLIKRKKDQTNYPKNRGSTIFGTEEDKFDLRNVRPATIIEENQVINAFEQQAFRAQTKITSDLSAVMNKKSKDGSLNASINDTINSGIAMKLLSDFLKDKKMKELIKSVESKIQSQFEAYIKKFRLNHYIQNKYSQRNRSQQRNRSPLSPRRQEARDFSPNHDQSRRDPSPKNFKKTDHLRPATLLSGGRIIDQTSYGQNNPSNQNAEFSFVRPGFKINNPMDYPSNVTEIQRLDQFKSQISKTDNYDSLFPKRENFNQDQFSQIHYDEKSLYQSIVRRKNDAMKQLKQYQQSMRKNNQNQTNKISKQQEEQMTRRLIKKIQQEEQRSMMEEHQRKLNEAEKKQKAFRQKILRDKQKKQSENLKKIKEKEKQQKTFRQKILRDKLIQKQEEEKQKQRQRIRKKQIEYQQYLRNREIEIIQQQQRQRQRQREKSKQRQSQKQKAKQRKRQKQVQKEKKQREWQREWQRERQRERLEKEFERQRQKSIQKMRQRQIQERKEEAEQRQIELKRFKQQKERYKEEEDKKNNKKLNIKQQFQPKPNFFTRNQQSQKIVDDWKKSRQKDKNDGKRQNNFFQIPEIDMEEQHQIMRQIQSEKHKIPKPSGNPMTRQFQEEVNTKNFGGGFGNKRQYERPTHKDTPQDFGFGNNFREDESERFNYEKFKRQQQNDDSLLKFAIEQSLIDDSKRANTNETDFNPNDWIEKKKKIDPMDILKPVGNFFAKAFNNVVVPNIKPIIERKLQETFDNTLIDFEEFLSGMGKKKQCFSLEQNFKYDLDEIEAFEVFEGDEEENAQTRIVPLSTGNSKGHMTIKQIHQNADQLHNSKDEFSIFVKVLQPVLLTFKPRDRMSNRPMTKLVVGDSTGIAVLYMNYFFEVKAGCCLKLDNCRLHKYCQSFEINHCRNITITDNVRDSSSIPKVDNSLMLSLIRKPQEGKYLYEVKPFFNLPLSYCVNQFNKNRITIGQITLKKPIIVTVCQATPTKKCVLGDYTGKIAADLSNTKRNIAININDTLLIRNAKLQINRGAILLITDGSSIVVKADRGFKFSHDNRYIPDKMLKGH